MNIDVAVSHGILILSPLGMCQGVGLVFDFKPYVFHGIQDSGPLPRLPSAVGQVFAAQEQRWK